MASLVNHQKHDFGIDGQIELLTAEGAVTGQMLGVQIKCGKSFLTERNKWGLKYHPTRGGRKQVLFDVRQMGDFLDRHTPSLNELKELMEMPIEEQDRIYFDIVRCLGLPVAANEEKGP